VLAWCDPGLRITGSEEPGAVVPHAGIWVAADKAAIPAGESPAVSIARLRHVVMPQFMRVIVCPLRGVNGLAALKTQNFSGGSNLEA